MPSFSRRTHRGSELVAAYLVLGALAGCASAVTGRDGAVGDASDTRDIDASPDAPLDFCAPGTLACTDAAGGARCIDPQTDRSNCGSCGVRCCGTCVNGACWAEGPAPTVVCSTGPDGCRAYVVDPRSDPQHCGSCEVVCAPGQICSSGTCTIECAPPRTVCGAGAFARCVDTTSDSANCGACANTCPGASHAHGMCATSTCATACDEGFADCNGASVDGCELDVSADDANCGACGHACAAPSRCIDSSCRRSWGEGYFATERIIPLDIATDRLGNIYVAGYFLGATVIGTNTLTSAGDMDGVVIALDPSGMVRWSRSIGSVGEDVVNAVATTASGDVIVGGSFQGSIALDAVTLTSSDAADGFVTLLDGTGHVRWATRFGATGSDAVYGVAASADGRIGIAAFVFADITFGGHTFSPLGGADVFVATLDAVSGAERWAVRGGGASDDFARRVRFTATGDLVASGTFRSPITSFGDAPLLGRGQTDGFVVAYRTDGSVRWERAFGGSGIDDVMTLEVDGAGNTYASGSFDAPVDFGTGTQSPAGQSDAFLVALGADGLTRWARTFGNANWEEASGLALLSTGAVAVGMSFTGTVDFGSAGFTASGSRDLAIATFAPDGAPLWAHAFVGTPGDARSIQLAATGGGGVDAAGYFGGTIDFGSGPISSPGPTSAYVLSYVR